VFEREVGTFRGELILGGIEVGLGVDERVGFNRGVLFKLEMFLNMGIV